MYGSGSMLGESAPVARGGVTLIAGQVVTREKRMPLVHASVAGNFGDDGGGGNGAAPGVSVNQRFLFDGKIDLSALRG